MSLLEQLTDPDETIRRKQGWQCADSCLATNYLDVELTADDLRLLAALQSNYNLPHTSTGFRPDRNEPTAEDRLAKMYGV